LPLSVSRKRGENNFVIAFWRAYERKMQARATNKSCLYSRELQITGFGIADLVCMTWEHPSLKSANGASAARVAEKRRNILIQAFEMKISGWKKGFAQACRYRFFAHRSFLVLPPSQAELAKKQFDLFEKTGIGLVAFDLKSGTIEFLCIPIKSEPKSARAHRIALDRLSLAPSKIPLKLSDALQSRF
jgi:hypothetical protein